MSEILTAYGIPKETVNAIMMLYKNTSAKVRSPDGDTDFFEISAGVLQGDTLAPYLFIIALDYALRQATENNTELGFTQEKAKSSRYPATKITDADYADDLAALSDNIEDATTLLQCIEESAKIIGLHINEKKTEYMSYNIPENSNITTTNGQCLSKVDDFTYLGSHLASTEKDISIRLTKAWAALGKLNNVWKSNLPRNIKIDFFRASVESILLYGCSTWSLTKKLALQLDGNYTRMLRAVINVTWRDKIRNNDLYGSVAKISDTIRERRLRFAGHSWRSHDEIIHDVLLWTPTHGRRSRGRPARTYLDQLMDDTSQTKEDLPRLMEDRKAWRELVKNSRASSTR